MSLPTPPGTSRRDKENRFAKGSRVAWSQQNQYHCLASPQVLQQTSISKDLPSKSILKKRSPSLLTIPDDNKREITPEPSDPLTDLRYLEYPVSRIISPDASLRDLIEAYSILTARVKASVTGATDVDSSWPLFEPLRQHANEVVDALIRDIGRATVDPGTGTVGPEEEQEKILLPSPKQSPRKKKGMTAEQVKYARDLCTTSHAVMKLLAVMFTLPAVYRVFNDEQLCSVLTAVLAIPLANELPTHNARKTYALSIWLLQVQRLPAEVLGPAKDRIAYALRRGVEGELGKEGKKGSASDGLKAIHDLCIHEPATFIPAFTELLPSIFSNLLAQTLTLRAQACHALGGFVLGCTSMPSSYVHTRVSAAVASFITTPNETISTSPSKSSQDPVIIRTLRTTLGATDPQHVAQGPVWALSVIASFIILLGPALCTDMKLTRIISALLSFSMRHKKSSVRAIGCLVWRCVAWVYVQPPLIQAGGECEGESGVDGIENDEAKFQNQIPVRESYWRILKSVVDMGTGVSTVAALLGKDANDDENLRRVMALIKLMVKRGGQTRGDAMEMVRNLVTCGVAETGWDSNKLLPPGLFSSSPGLLTVDYSSLVSVVKPIFDQCPQFDDVRSLTREELLKTWVFDDLIEIWKGGLSSLEASEDLDASSEIISIWDGLVKVNVAELQEAGDDTGIIQFALRAVNILAEILQDTNLDLTTKACRSPLLPTSPVKKFNSILPTLTTSRKSSKTAIKLSVTRKLWSVIRRAVPRELLNAAGEGLLKVLVEDGLVYDLDPPDEARKEWSLLCAEVLVVCDTEELNTFWESVVKRGPLQWAWTPDVGKMVWLYIQQQWLEGDGGSWEGAVILLAIPFADATNWDMSNEDFDSWDKFLCRTMTKALDYGVDSVTVLDQIACTLSCNHSPTLESSARVADMLMSHLEITDARQIPAFIFGFVNDTLQSSYPPEPRNKIQLLWTVRSLAQVFDKCPNELALNLLEIVQDGMCTWISDELRVLSQEEYTYDILPLYETLLLTVKAFPETIETLSTISPLLESAFYGRPDKPAAMSEAFIEFWQSTYSRMESPANGWPTGIQHCPQVALGRPLVAECEREMVIDGKEQELSYDADVSFDSPNIDNEELGYPDSDNAQQMNSKRPFLFIGPTNKILEPLTELLLAHSASPPPPTVIGSKQQESSTPGLFSRLPTVSDTPEEPSTPTRTILVTTATPPRPHKPSTVFPLYSLSPHSPTNAANKRRRLENKENIYSAIVSVTESIAVPSPLSPVLGKRRVSAHPPEQVVKKQKLSPSSIQTVGVCMEPESVKIATMTKLPSLLARDLLDLEAESALARTRSDSKSEALGISAKKRKRVFMDAVEVPTWQDVKNKSRIAGLNIRPPTTSQNQVSQSAMTLTKNVIPQNLDKKPRLKRASSVSAKDLFSDSGLAEIAGSDDSIMQPEPSQPGQSPSELPSDDDPWHSGQVNPHHLISPVLRRVQQDDYDPPSDDSNMSVSPSRDLVLRRQQLL